MVLEGGEKLGCERDVQVRVRKWGERVGCNSEVRKWGATVR